MKRRAFLIGVGVASVMGRPSAYAQAPMATIGLLDGGSPESAGAYLAAFRRGLEQTGYTEGRNLSIEYRWARDRADQLPALAADLVRRRVAVIAATRSPAPALAAKAATSQIPIVFQVGSDAVEDGLVPSLNRPGGNVTGASRQSTMLTPKRLEVLMELVPGATAIAALARRNSRQAETQLKEMEIAAHARGLRVQVLWADSAAGLDSAFAALPQASVGALVVINDPLFLDQRERIAALAAARAIPAIYPDRQYVVAGGLMSYAASLSDSFRQVGVYVGRILKGARPADLPVQQPTTFELVINLRAAKTLGVAIPPTLLAIADEVIE